MENQASRKPAAGFVGKVVEQAMLRGLIMRQCGASDGPPASGDSLCLAPPLMTPKVTIDRVEATARRFGCNTNPHC